MKPLQAVRVWGRSAPGCENLERTLQTATVWTRTTLQPEIEPETRPPTAKSLTPDPGVRTQHTEHMPCVAFAPWQVWSTCCVLQKYNDSTFAHRACCNFTFFKYKIAKTAGFVNFWNAWRVVILNRRIFTTRCVWKQNMHVKNNHPLCDNYIGPLGGV